MKKVLFATIACLFLIFISNVSAQNPNRHFENYNIDNGKIKIQVNDGTYSLVPFSEQIIHTTFTPNDTVFNNFSYAVETKAKALNFIVNESSDKLTLQNHKIKIEVAKSPFQIKYYYDNNLVLNENYGYEINDSTQTMNLGITKEEVLYGAGARVLGMNRRGYKLELYNRAHYGYETHSELMNYTLPVFISSKKYTVLFDNASKGWLDLDSKENNTVTYETTNGTINYYVVFGNTWYDLTEQYTYLTGRQPLLPRWALGNFSSRFGYHSQTETENTVNKFFEDSIPLDAVIIDIYWFGKDVTGHMGNLEWYRDSFPDPEKMMQDFEKKGVKTILVTEPFILTTCNRWDEAVKKQVLGKDSLGNAYTYDFFFGNTGLVDVFDETARDWFWNIYKGLVNQGVGGWWGDLGEPEVHPADLQHANGSADDVHNAYGHEWAKVIYDGYRKDFPNTRPFILMRSGYAGSQRYGMIPWTGDVSRSWGGLIPQIEISLQMGMQGIAYMHSDLGGFAGGDSLNNEMYTRWLQYGVFQPIYRPHAQEAIPSEPVFQIDETKQRAKKAIELRYKLLPYNYSLAMHNSTTGRPLMSPLFFIEPDNTDLLTYDKAYLWGDAFLVSPVTKAGLKEQKVYLPKNNEWFNFYTDEKFSGGQTINTDLSIDNIPVFVKSGSFIPMLPEAKNAKHYSLKNFDMHYYYSDNATSSNYSLYNDNGNTPVDILNDQEFYAFSSQVANNKLSIKIDKTIKGNALCEENTITFIVHNIADKPEYIYVNNQKLKKNEFNYNSSNKTVELYIKLKDKCSIVFDL